MAKHAAEHAGHTRDRFENDQSVADRAGRRVDVIVPGGQVEGVVRCTDAGLQDALRKRLRAVLVVRREHPFLDLVFGPDVILLSPGVISEAGGLWRRRRTEVARHGRRERSDHGCCDGSHE